MKIKKTFQLEIDNIRDIDFDIIISSSGYETRSRYLCEFYHPNAHKKVVLGFDNYTDLPTRKTNDLAFKIAGYESILSSGDSEKEVFDSLKFLLKLNKDAINILVDYSSMTRIWYAAVLKFISLNNFGKSSVNIYFSYSFSRFVLPPTEPSFNRHVGPIEGFYQISIPDRPTAVIIGLGYVESRAYGLAEYFDVEPHLFIADSSVSNDYYNHVISNNSDLLHTVKNDNIFTYPLDNMVYTETLVSHLSVELKSKYRIVLAPCGPKPFTLICLVTALRNNFVDVWRISAGVGEQPTDKKESGKILVYCISF